MLQERHEERQIETTVLKFASLGKFGTGHQIVPEVDDQEQMQDPEPAPLTPSQASIHSNRSQISTREPQKPGQRISWSYILGYDVGTFGVRSQLIKDVR